MSHNSAEEMIKTADYMRVDPILGRDLNNAITVYAKVLQHPRLTNDQKNYIYTQIGCAYLDIGDENKLALRYFKLGADAGNKVAAYNAAVIIGHKAQISSNEELEMINYLEMAADEDNYGSTETYSDACRALSFVYYRKCMKKISNHDTSILNHMEAQSLLHNCEIYVNKSVYNMVSNKKDFTELCALIQNIRYAGYFDKYVFKSIIQ